MHCIGRSRIAAVPQDVVASGCASVPWLGADALHGPREHASLTTSPHRIFPNVIVFIRLSLDYQDRPKCWVVHVLATTAAGHGDPHSGGNIVRSDFLVAVPTSSSWWACTPVSFGSACLTLCAESWCGHLLELVAYGVTRPAHAIKQCVDQAS